MQALITFDELPSADLIRQRAEELARFAKATDAEAVMVGGAPFFMAPLEAALRAVNIIPVYAFSKRESVEEKQPDGSVKKTQVFKHAGFVPACDCGGATGSFPSEELGTLFQDIVGVGQTSGAVC